MKDLQFCINSYYLNIKLLNSIFDSTVTLNIQSNLSHYKEEYQRKMKTDLLYIDETIKFIQENNIPDLHELILSGKVSDNILVTYQKSFYYKKFKEKKSNRESIKFHLKHKEFSNLNIHGTFATEHFTCNTAYTNLSGRYRAFFLSFIESHTNEDIILKPILIGDRLIQNKNSANTFNVSLSNEIKPENIDEFHDISKIEFRSIDDKVALNTLKGIPEKEIKNRLASIIHQNNIPKDWGGEKSDLFTSHLHINNERISGAFILKGPAKFEPMILSSLGKNGDQIVRLFEEPADLFILQHCHYITSAVKSMMEAFATRHMRIRNFMIIDGIDTYRILKAYNKL